MRFGEEENLNNSMSDATDDGQRRLEFWAADHVKPWGELQADDYNFRSWAKGASKNCMQAGAVYEYARESRKLRCLLALMNPKRPREQWERSRRSRLISLSPQGSIFDAPSDGWLAADFTNQIVNDKALSAAQYRG